MFGTLQRRFFMSVDLDSDLELAVIGLDMCLLKVGLSTQNANVSLPNHACGVMYFHVNITRQN